MDTHVVRFGFVHAVPCWSAWAHNNDCWQPASYLAVLSVTRPYCRITSMALRNLCSGIRSLAPGRCGRGAVVDEETSVWADHQPVLGLLQRGERFESEPEGGQRRAGIGRQGLLRPDVASRDALNLMAGQSRLCKRSCCRKDHGCIEAIKRSSLHLVRVMREVTKVQDRAANQKFTLSKGE